MPDILTSTGALKATTGLGWINQLVKAWKRISEERREELARTVEEFGDLRALAEIYIEPDCQPGNPSDIDEEEPLSSFRTPILPWLRTQFLNGTFRKHDGRHVLLILSDAGMGKSSLLMMLKLSHEMGFWPSDIHFELIKIRPADRAFGEPVPDTVERIKKLKNQPKTVLLLDALDEDPSAWGRIEERLGELLRASRPFRQVLLTCRTQFFPKGIEEKAVEKKGFCSSSEIQGFNCKHLYVSPFSDEQIRAYLDKVLPQTLIDRLKKMVTKQESESMLRALGILDLMRSLQMRPMLLAHIEDLIHAEVETGNMYTVYDTLVDEWLRREVAKGKIDYSKEELRAACIQVARLAYDQKSRHISEPGLDAHLVEDSTAAQIRAIDLKGRTLLNRTSDGDYRFAHYSIQEFLVAESFIKGEGDLRLEATDMVQELILAWVQTDPLERVQLLRWSLLGTLSGVSWPNPVDLIGANLIGANLIDVNLIGADLTGADLTGADLTGADLRDANLRDANLRDTNLRGADLTNADLTGAMGLSQAQIQEAQGNAKTTKLPETLKPPHSWILLTGGSEDWNDWRRANLNVLPNLLGAYLRGTNLIRANLTGANLTGANLTSADVIGANLTGANLTGANLTGANLTGANLRGADLTDADLTDANLRGANLHGAMGLSY